jgi:hypothetical protein
VIEIVSATRFSESEFWNTSALGISLRRLKYDSRLVAHLAFTNKRGLPDVYNSRILASEGHDLLVFVHDDIWIDDYYLADRVIDGLRKYDVIGVAGNRRRIPNQPGWAFVDTNWTWDAKSNLSGAVAHGDDSCGPVSFYGEAPASCELLDGAFLAARKSALTAREVRFDPRFDFHFYDMDFCRSARREELRLGTWPICLTHQSVGRAYGSEHWNKRYLQYLDKWKN